MLVALIHGMIYVWLVPPWQHYDEPGHFEYAWLIGQRARLPQTGDYDPVMRLAVAESMIRYGFYVDRVLPDLTVQPITIAPIMQLDNPPLYYILVSPVTRLTAAGNVTRQLYLLRMASLSFLALSVLAAWGVAAELTPPEHLLRWLLPLFLALLPGFIDVMSAVNSDVAAIAFTSLALWGCVRLVQRGPSLSAFLFAGIPTVLAVFSKEIGLFILPVFALAWVLALIPQKHLAWAVLGVVLAAGAGASLILRSDDAAFWYRSTTQPEGLRAAYAGAPHGSYVLRLDPEALIPSTWMPPILQPIPRQSLDPGRPLTVTVGAWMWQEQPGVVRGPQIALRTWSDLRQTELSTEPAFVAFTATLPVVGTPFRLILWPYRGQAQDRPIVYYDGLVVAQGEYPVNEAPVFADDGAVSGQWGGKPFTNLLRNGSMEQPGWRFATPIDTHLARLMSEGTLPSLYLTAILDWDGAGWYFRTAFAHLVRTGMARSGWGNVPLPGARPYRFWGYIGLVLLLLGAVWSAWSLRRKEVWSRIPWKTLLLLALLLVFAWGSTWMRGAAHVGTGKAYIPVARYAFPAIIPTAMLFSLGLAGLGQMGGWKRYFSIIMFTMCFIGLSATAIYGIRLFYMLR